MYITINVTETDIAAGFRLQSGRCPVFLAMRNVNIPVEHCYTNTYTLAGQNQRSRYMPLSVRAKIRQYDQGGTMQPFSFRVHIAKRILQAAQAAQAAQHIQQDA